MKIALLNRLLEDRAAKRPVALATWMENGRQALVYADDAHGELAGDDAVVAAARDSLVRDKSAVVTLGGDELFVQVFNPPLRFIIVGAVHIAQPLARMAALAGYDVTVIDPRRSFATDDRFPGVALMDGWPDEALGALQPDRRTAVVTLTHDPKLDDPALAVALRSEAFYIGALGSRKTHAARLGRLRDEGFGDGETARIHGPVGISIGAVSPAEIAVAILAQVTDVLREKPAKEAA